MRAVVPQFKENVAKFMLSALLKKVRLEARLALDAFY